MIMKNRYEKNIEEFIAERKKIHTSMTKCSDLGKWDCFAWGVSPNRFRFTRRRLTNMRTLRNKAERLINKDDCIDTYYLNFLKAYLSYKFYELGKTYGRLTTDCHAFLDFCLILEEEKILISDISQSNITSFHKKIRELYAHSTCEMKSAAIINLINFLQKNRMLKGLISLKNPFKYENSSYQILENKKNNLPSEQTINIISEIYNKTIPLKGHPIKPDETPKTLIALSITGLLFSSPMRIGELDLLTINPIKKIEIKGEEVYSLIWRGSKGMTDNEKHIHKGMSGVADRSIYCLKKVGEKARVLARYYENPNATLKEILGTFPSNYNFPKNLNRPTTLWEIGFIIGIYTEEKIAEIKQKRICYQGKINSLPIKFGTLNPNFPHSINNNCIITRQFFSNLLLTGPFQKKIKIIFKKEILSIGEALEAWIKHIYSCNPSFPYYIAPNEKKIPLKTALIMVNGGEHFRGTQLGTSPFFIRKPDKLSFFNTVFSNKLSKSAKYSTNIFFINGYDPKTYSFNSNQARHYQNTLAQRADLREELIAQWSGRVSTQQNKVYNHETIEEIESKFIQKGVIEESRNIIPVTIEEFETTTNSKLASKTSTGFCTQSLEINPCTYMQVGISGCTGCSKHCYIKGDKNSLKNLEEDLSIQCNRVMDEKMSEKDHNPIMNKWHNLHISNIEFLNTLISILKNEEIPDGSIIRYVKNKTFNVVTDGNKQTLEFQFSLPEKIKEITESNNHLTHSLIDNQKPTEKSEFDLLLESLS